MTPVRAKGVSFRGAMQQLERRGGRELLDRVLARVGGEAGEALRHGAVVSGGWYPAAWYAALLEAVEAEHPSDPDAIRSLTREAVTEDFRTIFRLLSWVVSPEAALRNAVKIMARYWEGGRVEVLEARDGHVHFLFADYHGFTPQIWSDVVGGIEPVLDLMKVTRERIEPRNVSGDGSRCEMIVCYRTT